MALANSAVSDHSVEGIQRGTKQPATKDREQQPRKKPLFTLSDLLILDYDRISHHLLLTHTNQPKNQNYTKLTNFFKYYFFLNIENAASTTVSTVSNDCFAFVTLKSCHLAAFLVQL